MLGNGVAFLDTMIITIQPDHPHVNQIITGAPMIATKHEQQPANPRIACIHNYRAQVGTDA